MILLVGNFKLFAEINPKFIKMGWSFAAPIILKEIKDPLAKKVIQVSVPKLIDKDFKTAAYDIAQVVSTERNIKILNKQYLTLVEKDLTDTYINLKSKDFAGAVNNLITICTYTDRFIKTGKLEIEDDKSIAKSSSDISNQIDRNIIKDKIFFSEDDSYFFFAGNNKIENNKNINSKFFISRNQFDLKNKDNQSFNVSIDVDSSKISNINFYKNNEEELSKLTKRFEKYINENGFYNLIKKEFKAYENFNSINYLFRFQRDTLSGMSLVNIMFYNSRMFIIKYEAADDSYKNTLSSFEEFLSNLYIDNVNKIEDEKSYTKLRIKQVKIDKIPFKDKNGETWDYSSGGFYPDIYYTINNEKEDRLYELNFLNRAENVNEKSLPFAFKLIDKEIIIDDLSSTFIVRLYDYDSFDEPDFIGGVKIPINKFMTGDKAYSKELEIETLDVKITVIVNWE
jgi:hypothetical protein